VNRHFQAKRAKYPKLNIIETTAWITPIKTTKYGMLVVQKREEHIQDGGWPPSWKPPS